MSEEKNQLLRGLGRPEQEVLHELFKDPKATNKELGERLRKEPDSVGTNLTKIYKELRMPEGVPNDQKKHWVVTEYTEEYKEVFQGSTEYKKPQKSTFKPDKPDGNTQEPHIHRRADPPRVRRNIATIAILGTLFVVAVAAIAILSNAIIGINQGRNPTVQAQTEIVEETFPPPETEPPLVEVTNTEIPTLAPTITPKVSLNFTPALPPTPQPTQAYYVQDERWSFKPGMTIYLESTFLNINSSLSCTGNENNIVLQFNIRNDTDDDFRVVFEPSNVKYIDDLGKTYEPVCAFMGLDLITSHYVDGIFTYFTNNDEGAFYPALPKPNAQARYLYIIFENISGVGPVTFRKDLY